MTNPTNTPTTPVPPPSRHQLALMIWLCVFPTLAALNLAFGAWFAPMPTLVRTFVLATIAVPIVIYGLMPHLHRARARLLARFSASRSARGGSGGPGRRPGAAGS